MKKSLFKLLALPVLVAVLVTACKKDKDYLLESLTAGGTDLNGAQSATSVAANSSIVATFTQDIDAATATSANIQLVRDYDNATLATTITVAGKAVTIDPVEDLGTGTLYKLNVGAGVAFADGKSNVVAFSRTFTTSGTFAPSGAIAHWTFEDNAQDQVGNYDASAQVAVTYTASRNAAAGKAATFDGDASIIEIPKGDELMTSTNFSLSFWVKTNSTGHVDAGGNPAGYFVMGLGAFYGFQFEIPSDFNWCKLAGRYDLGATTGSEDMFFNGDGKTFANGGWQGWDFSQDLSTSGGVASLLKDRWAHVTYVYNGASRQGILFIDGVKRKSFDFDLWPDGDAKRSAAGMKFGGTAPEVVNELAFGFIQSRAGTLWDAEPWGGYDVPTANHFKGQLDDVRIFHKALTDDEIRLMYNSEK